MYFINFTCKENCYERKVTVFTVVPFNDEPLYLCLLVNCIPDLDLWSLVYVVLTVNTVDGANSRRLNYT